MCAGPTILRWFLPAPPTPQDHATSNHGDAHPGRDERRSTKPLHQSEGWPAEGIAAEDERACPECGRPQVPGQEAAVADAMGTRDGQTSIRTVATKRPINMTRPP
jgi:hypothetical protein